MKDLKEGTFGTFYLQKLCLSAFSHSFLQIWLLFFPQSPLLQCSLPSPFTCPYTAHTCLVSNTPLCSTVDRSPWELILSISSWQESHMEDMEVALVKGRAILELNFRNYPWCFENKSSAVKGQVLENPWEATAHLFMVLNLSRKYQVIIKLFNK